MLRFHSHIPETSSRTPIPFLLARLLLHTLLFAADDLVDLFKPRNSNLSHERHLFTFVRNLGSYSAFSSCSTQGTSKPNCANIGSGRGTPSALLATISPAAGALMIPCPTCATDTYKPSIPGQASMMARSLSYGCLVPASSVRNAVELSRYT